MRVQPSSSSNSPVNDLPKRWNNFKISRICEVDFDSDSSASLGSPARIGTQCATHQSTLILVNLQQSPLITDSSLRCIRHSYFPRLRSGDTGSRFSKPKCSPWKLVEFYGHVTSLLGHLLPCHSLKPEPYRILIVF